MVRHDITLTSPTGKLVLTCPSDQDDNERIALLRTHPETLRYLPILPKTMTVEDVIKRRESRLDDPKTLDWNVDIVDADGKRTLVAMTTIFAIDEEYSSGETGILVAPDAHRSGLGTEVLYTVLKYGFETMKLHRIQFQTGADNVGMRGWLDRVAGAYYEGARRDGWKGIDGKFADVAVYSILEDEWREKTKRLLLERLKVEDES
ncbi:acyl-CoA N-acyltransferase [Schizophyllum commune H4-8]|uniref:N-acetyltransferase domain-containing protein n=1 Tax=Schizophyllum commune (strain H4-8 / FGSC 9210) TaxID=578458 RepID=D8QBY5_SCHCM|nr:acyl-CoA N-acyltransferase [Schizophyllum commune H4-8]KAI5889364.1 acyl-CoA N-acyltransferase [Schizophyllum commune H4-8]